MSGQLTALTVSSVSVRASGSGSWAHGHAADAGAPGSGLGTCSRRSAACGSGGRREVCKTVGSAYVGSNPTPATTCGNGLPGCGYAPGRPFSSRHAVYRGPPRRAEVRATRGRRGRARRSQAKVAARAEHRLRRRDPGPGGGHGSRGRGGGIRGRPHGRPDRPRPRGLRRRRSATSPALPTPARPPSSTHDAVAVCYRFVT